MIFFFLKAYLDFLVFKGKATCLDSSILSEICMCAFIFWCCLPIWLFSLFSKSLQYWKPCSQIVVIVFRRLLRTMHDTVSSTVLCVFLNRFIKFTKHNYKLGSEMFPCLGYCFLLGVEDHCLKLLISLLYPTSDSLSFPQGRQTVYSTCPKGNTAGDKPDRL